MPFYELVAVAKPSTDFAPLRNLLTSTGTFLRGKGGAVRDIRYWGRRTLPQRPSKAKARRGPDGELIHSGECVAPVQTVKLTRRQLLDDALRLQPAHAVRAQLADAQ